MNSYLTTFCDEVAFITTSAALLSRPALPDPSGSRDDIYLHACAALNSLYDKGQLDETFFDYLAMHLDFAFAQGGAGSLQ